MKTILAVVVASFCLAATGNGACEFKTEEDLARDKCKQECTNYGAAFANLSRVPGGFGHADDYECWCRRGAESGGGSEPLRIW